MTTSALRRARRSSERLAVTSTFTKTKLPRVLIYGTCHIADATMRELVSLWTKCADTINPDCDVVIIDAPSPYGPEKITGWPFAFETFLKEHRWVFKFRENAGHLNRGGKDGAGRAFVQGMLLAMEGGYDYCVHNECDLLMTKPVRPWIDRMHRGGVKCASPFDSYYQFMEGGLSFYNVEWLRQSRFVERYDWQNQVGNPIPEIAIERLCGDELFTLPIRGVRNEFGQVTRSNVNTGFPYGFDYITHCYADFEIYRELMRRNGVEP